MQLTEKAKSICRQFYICYKTPGCGKCPIIQTCHAGRQYPVTTDGNSGYISAINLAAERV